VLDTETFLTQHQPLPVSQMYSCQCEAVKNGGGELSQLLNVS